MWWPTMTDAGEPMALTVDRCGCVAWPLFHGPAAGRVAAVFERSFYLEVDGALACVGTRDLDASPLNLTTSAPAGTDWRASGVGLGDRVAVGDRTVRVGRRQAFRFAASEPWTPAPLPAPWDGDSLREGLAAFRSASRHRLPDQGLGFLVQGDAMPADHNTIAAPACARIAPLRRWLRAWFRGRRPETAPLRQAVGPLLGLGPGLTPSGSDLIGGTLIALHALGRPETCHQLWQPLRPTARAAANPIAAAHLAAAAKGYGNAALHAALAAVIPGRGNAMAAAMDGLDGIGHTSGWDAMAGAVLALDTWLQAHRPEGESPQPH